MNECRCDDPWTKHVDGFRWGTPPDGSVHIVGGYTIFEVERKPGEGNDARGAAARRSASADQAEASRAPAR